MNTVHKFYKKLEYFIYPRSFDLFSQHSCQGVNHRAPKLPGTGNTFSRSFFSNKFVRPLWNELNRLLVYLNILTQSIAITDSMFNFGNFFINNAITFDLTEIEKKKSRQHEILLRIQCCHQKCQNRKRKISIFSKIFFTKSPIFRKVQIFRKNKIYFQILEVLPVILTTYLPI